MDAHKNGMRAVMAAMQNDKMMAARIARMYRPPRCPQGLV
jgi:hypothetical protein